MASISATASPFTAHVLAGWEPVHPHIRYPVTMSLHREGANHVLFLAPMNLSLLQSMLPIASSDQALIVTSDPWGNESLAHQTESIHKRPWSTIGQLSNEVDIIHLPRHSKVDTSAIHQLTPIMVAPDAAVPEQWGSRLAIGFNDHCHATIITPKRDIIRSALKGFISAYVESALGEGSRVPEIPNHLQDVLLAPMLPGEWTDIRVQPHRRYWTIDFAHQGDVANSTQWVAPAHHGYWRSGWSW